MKIKYRILAICLIVSSVLLGFDKENVKRITIDNVGNILLQSYTREPISEEGNLKMFDRDGNLMWTKIVKGTLLENLNEKGLFVERKTARELSVLRFNKNGNQTILSKITLPLGREYGEIIKVLPDGYLYFTLDRKSSYYSNSPKNDVKPNGSVTYILLKFNLKGDLIQSRVVGKVTWVEHEFSEICKSVDSQGNFYVIGEDYGNDTRNIVFYKFNVRGEIEQHKSLISPIENWLVVDMAIDNKDQVYFTGLTSGYITETNQVVCNMFIGKYRNGNDNLVIRKLEESEPSEGKVLRISNRKNLFILGNEVEVRNGKPVGRYTNFIVKLSESTKKLWLTSLGTYWTERKVIMNVDQSENVYLAEDDFESYWVKKISSSGKLLWSKRIWNVKNLVFKMIGLLGLVLLILQLKFGAKTKLRENM